MITLTVVDFVVFIDFVVAAFVNVVIFFVTIKRGDLVEVGDAIFVPFKCRQIKENRIILQSRRDACLGGNRRM